MRPKIREILEECIETGIESGYIRAHKHNDNPYSFHIYEQIENAIWLEIDERFDFERNIYNEVMEGLDHLPKHLRPKLLHPLEHEEEPRDGEIRAVNYIISAVEDGQPIAKHRIEQYYSGEWREIKVYDEDENGSLSAREIDRLRAKKKEIYEDLKDAVDREWVGLTREEQHPWIWDLTHKNINVWDLCDRVEAKLKEKNT